MLRNHRLARAIADVGMHEFRRQMSYKAQWNGLEIGYADPWYPSSKMCSQCGHLKQELPLSKRTYRCDVCGLVIGRDLNAARNLARLAATASSAERNACGEDVPPGVLFE